MRELIKELKGKGVSVLRKCGLSTKIMIAWLRMPGRYAVAQSWGFKTFGDNYTT
jgi:hypothetical protein